MELTVHVFGDVVIECFFGGESTNEKIKGKSLAVFVKSLIDSILVQSKEPLSVILGNKYLEIGISERDREINESIKIFDAWGKSFLKKRLR
jgi:hypothetical protein